MMHRSYNFSAGPAGTPVLEQAQAELLNWKEDLEPR